MSKIEFGCLNSREDFEGNKSSLKARLDSERNVAIWQLLEKELLFLDRIQIQTASAREFLVTLRFMNTDDIMPTVSRVKKLLNEQGFFARLAEKDDLKRIFAVYCVQNMTQVVLDDYDGERWG